MTITQINISIPKCEKGIGDVILAPDSPKLIEGVKCVPITLWPDDRGYFLEVLPGPPADIRAIADEAEAIHQNSTTVTSQIIGFDGLANAGCLKVLRPQ